MTTARLTLVLASLVLAAHPLRAQQAPAQQQPTAAQPSASTQTQQSAQPDSGGPIFTLHATARLVVLDVVVSDDQGKPVRGLKPSDFTLTEDGVPQRLLSLTEHDASDASMLPAPETALPPNTFASHAPVSAETPKVVIVLDNLSFSDAPYVRDEIRAFLKTLVPGTPIAIFRVDWQGLHLVQSLTADAATLQEAASSQRILPPLGFPVRYMRHIGSPTQQLASYLAAIPGRINLVWFGTGLPGGHDEGFFPNFSGGIPPDLAAFVARESAAPNVLRLSRIALYPIDTNGPGSVLHCQELMEMANSAGGKAYCNTNGFKEALADVVLSGSHYYTVSYSPGNGDWNGKYRHIKVEVGPEMPVTAWDKIAAWLDPMNSKVIYRDGYFARDVPARPSVDPEAQAVAAQGAVAPETAQPEQQRRLISYSPRGDPGTGPRPGDSAAAMRAAMAFGMATPFQLPVTVTVSPAAEKVKLRATAPLPKDNFMADALRGQPFRNVRVHYSIQPKDLQFTQIAGQYADAIEFVAVVYRDDGLQANSISYTAHINVDPEQYFEIMANGLSYDQTIAIPVPGNPLPGSFFLRTAVRELPTNRIGAIEVPDEWIKLPVASPVAAAKPASGR